MTDTGPMGEVLAPAAPGMPGTPGGSRRLRIAMTLFSDLTFDSRVQREANALVAAGHAVTILCTEGSADSASLLDPGVSVVALRAGGRPKAQRANPFRTTRGVSRFARRAGFLLAYARGLDAWGREAARHTVGFDVLHAHDYTGLVAATAARPAGAALVYDMHDLFLDTEAGTRLPAPARAALLWHERRLARRADLLVTVNRGLAGWVQAHFAPGPIAIVHNCVPRPVDAPQQSTRIRERLGLAAADRIVLYHGMLGPDRGIEMLFASMLQPGLDRAHLVLLGFGPDRDHLATEARDHRYGGRVHVLDAVPPKELRSWVSSADVGVMPNQPRTLNERLSTPNKLFESIGAGLPVVSSDFPERRRIIVDDPLGPLGAVCDSTNTVTLAAAIRSVIELDNEALMELRLRCAQAARDRWNWETQAETLVAAYARLAASRRPGGPR